MQTRKYVGYMLPRMARFDSTRLRDLRERNALTQQELADKAGVTRLTVARVEAGLQPPRPPTVRKLAKALKVRPQDLMEPAK